MYIAIAVLFSFLAREPDQKHSLYIGSQFETNQRQTAGVGGTPLMKANGVQQHENTRNGASPSTRCQYHRSVLNGSVRSNTEGFVGIDRLLCEGSAEQSAVLVRPDNGQLSTSKGCCC